MLYFDIMVIVFSEISSIDITKAVPIRIYLSFFSSIAIMIFIIAQILNTKLAIKKLREAFKSMVLKKIQVHYDAKTSQKALNDKDEVKVTKRELNELIETTMTYSDTKLIEKYSEGLNLFLYLDNEMDLLILEECRFILI